MAHWRDINKITCRICQKVLKHLKHVLDKTFGKFKLKVYHAYYVISQGQVIAEGSAGRVEYNRFWGQYCSLS